MNNEVIVEGDIVYYLIDFDGRHLGLYHSSQRDLAFAEKYRRYNYPDVYVGKFSLGVFPEHKELEVLKKNT